MGPMYIETLYMYNFWSWKFDEYIWFFWDVVNFYAIKKTKINSHNFNVAIVFQQKWESQMESGWLGQAI